jgi:glycerophosphoryl diester phosphodiesterase
MAQRPLLLGHRGMRGFPSLKENTIEAFDVALQHGCDGFEFDLRLTADGRAVVCHDPENQGVTIARAGAGRLQQLPQLEHVLQRFHRKAFLDIELKVAGLEDRVMELLRQFPPQRGYVISSFLPEVLKRVDPRLPRGLISETTTQLKRWASLEVEYVMLHWKVLSEKLVQKTHGSGAKIFTWTVNDATRMRQFAAWGVDGIISDDPRLLVETVG